jgi:hypothetical protein
MKIRTILFILFVLTISSCEKYINVPIPEESNKLVLNLLMNKDSLMMATVTLSGRLSGATNLPDVTNATVKLYENETFKETLTPYLRFNRFYFRSSTLPKSGYTYRLTAEAPGYGEVSGSDYIPDTVKIGELKMTVAQMNSWQTKTTISVQLHDDPAVQNYYRIRVYQVNEWVDANGNGGSQKLQQYFESEEANLGIFNNASDTDFYTTDALFNGRSPRFIFKINTDSKFKKMLVEVSSLTYDSYNYLNSAFMAREKNEDAFSEKVIVYNNIKNGLGIVGGVAQREYLLVR